MKYKYRRPEHHGMGKTTEYRSWDSMKQRSYNKKCHNYHRYGGRGITVCDRWKNSFANFLEDMGVKPFKGAQIDRIENDGNYNPDNCEWTSTTQNNRNKSTTKLTMIKAREIRKKYNKENVSSRELADLYNVCCRTIGDVLTFKTWREA